MGGCLFDHGGAFQPFFKISLGYRRLQGVSQKPAPRILPGR